MSVIKGDIIKARFKINFGGFVTIAGIKLCIKDSKPPFLLLPRETYHSKKGVKKVAQIVFLNNDAEDDLLQTLIHYYELLLRPDNEIEIINESKETT